MALNKFIPTSPDLDIVQDSDLAPARFGHLNRLVDEINSEFNELKLSETIPYLTYKSTITSPGGRVWDDGAVYKNTAAFRSHDDGNTYIYDITDTSNPVLASTITSTSGGFTFENGILYLLQSGSGNNFRAYDMANPYSPVLASEVTLTGSIIVEYVKKFGNLLFIESTVESIEVLDVSNPYDIKSLGALTLPTNFLGEHGFAISNDYVVAWAANNIYKVWKINWINLTFTEILSGTDPFPGSGTSGCLGIVTNGSSRFYAIGSTKITVFDIINDQLVLLNVITNKGANGPGENIKSFGEYIAVTSSGGYVTVYDMTDPLNIVLEQELDVRSYATNMRAIQGDADKLMLNSRNTPSKLIVLEADFYKAGVLKVGEFVSKEADIDTISSIGISAKTMGAENGGFGNLLISKKFVFPKYTTAERTALVAEAGEAVYDTDTNKLYVYDGTTWQATW